jgi:hypothetical protein
MKTLRNWAAGLAIVLSGVAFGTAPSSAQSSANGAPSPEIARAAQEFVYVINTQLLAETTATLTTQVWPPVEAALREQNAKVDAATLDELRKEFERLMVVNLTEVMKDAPAIYAKYFTVKEMQDLVAFYRTPLGAKALRVMPQAAGDLNTKLLPRMPGLQEKVSLAFMNILQKRGLYAQ